MCRAVTRRREDSGVAGARTGAKAGARMRAKLTSCAWLGAAIVVGVTCAMSLAVISSCPADPLTGGGELRVSGPAIANLSVLAPVYPEAGLEEVPADGVHGPLVWWGGCGAILDCAVYLSGPRRIQPPRAGEDAR